MNVGSEECDNVSVFDPVVVHIGVLLEVNVGDCELDGVCVNEHGNVDDFDRDLELVQENVIRTVLLDVEV